MKKHQRENYVASPRTHLAASIALICGSVLMSHAGGVVARMPAFAPNATAGSTQPDGATLQFTNCDDHGPGSLRETIAAAAEGATISASMLTCSTITLTTGAIFVNQNDLRIDGFNADGTSVTLDANNTDRVIFHTGTGHLALYSATVTNGVAGLDTGTVRGGCVWSHGSLVLDFDDVNNCTLTTRSGTALGGGIYAQGTLVIANSTLSGNLADALDGGAAKGGGAYAKQGIGTVFSTVSYNTAKYLNGGTSSGGGLFTVGPSSITSSTIDHNQARFGAGVEIDSTGMVSSIVDSTISSNTAADSGGGISTNSPLQLYNSTIAFNTANGFGGGGMYLANGGLPVPLTIFSAIVANNATPSPTLPGSDISGEFTASGGNNLVPSSGDPLPADTITADPQLQPLRDNGGPTLTHALSASSPAIDRGSNPMTLSVDQRFYTRVVGTAADIGAFEWQGAGDGDTIFANGFDP